GRCGGGSGAGGLGWLSFPAAAFASRGGVGYVDPPACASAPSARERPMPASALMNVMIAAARKAGRGLARDFGEIEQLQVSVKGPANFVSAADHPADETLFR